MGFPAFTEEMLQNAGLEEIGVEAAFNNHEEILVREYDIEILQQPILEELQVRIEFAEIITIDDEALSFDCPKDEHDKSSVKVDCKIVDEDLIRELRLPLNDGPFWSYVVLCNSFL